jgi:hypothetical protein
MSHELYAVLNNSWSKAPITSIKEELSVDWNLMTLETIAHLAAHGLKQKINDPNGAKTLTDSDKRVNSLKVLDSLHANTFRIVSTRSGDPIETELMKLARNIVANKLLSKGFKLKDYKMADLDEKAEAMLEKYPNVEADLRAQATATIESKKKAYAEIEIEI